MKKSDLPYPEGNIKLNKMNRIMRHKLRNLCAGVRMTVDRISETAAATHPGIPTRCDVINDELDRLLVMTNRMDLLFDDLPDPVDFSLFELIADSREFFSKEFPFTSLHLRGEQIDKNLKHASWWKLALYELLQNAGEAAGDKGTVELSWDLTPSEFVISIVNNGELIPEEIPITPPEPFNTAKGRHDGLGLSIACRICKEAESELIIDNNPEGCVNITLKLPHEELFDV